MNAFAQSLARQIQADLPRVLEIVWREWREVAGEEPEPADADMLVVMAVGAVSTYIDGLKQQALKGLSNRQERRRAEAIFARAGKNAVRAVRRGFSAGVQQGRTDPALPSEEEVDNYFASLVSEISEGASQ